MTTKDIYIAELEEAIVITEEKLSEIVQCAIEITVAADPYNDPVFKLAKTINQCVGTILETNREARSKKSKETE